MTEVVRLTQLDGKLPNLALMRIAAFHRARGDEIRFTRSVHRHLDEPRYDRVYGSCIFKFTQDRLERFLLEFPDAIVGGTGTGNAVTVEQATGTNSLDCDYSPYPDFTASIGFTQRGCRLSCKFCVVPDKEGKPKSVASIYDIWRGGGFPRHLHLLDNDFFGGTNWRERIAEIRDGGFKVCFSQGINVRQVNDEVAEALASVDYRDTKFGRARLYTAWDNLKDRDVFFKGIDCLERHGIPPTNVTAYMLIGFDKKETPERREERAQAMIERGIEPYPMPFDQSNPDLKRFQRWAVRHAYRKTPFRDYKTKNFAPNDDQIALF